MIPWKLIDTVTTPDGKRELSLHQRGQEFSIRVAGQELMNSRRHGSEEALAELAAQSVTTDAPRVLVGGLGMGFTLAEALRCFPAGTSFEVAELSPAVVAWNRGLLAELAGHPLADTRVQVREGDIKHLLKASQRVYDAILLDIDNGPDPLTQKSNGWLYSHHGLISIAKALRPRGVLSVWSAGADEPFEKRLRAAALPAQAHWIRARGNKRGPKHCVWVARKG